MAYKCITKISQVLACAKIQNILKVPTFLSLFTECNFNKCADFPRSIIKSAAALKLERVFNEMVRKDCFCYDESPVVPYLRLSPIGHECPEACVQLAPYPSIPFKSTYKSGIMDVICMVDISDEKLTDGKISCRKDAKIIKTEGVGIPDRSPAAGVRRERAANAFKILSRYGKFERCSSEVPSLLGSACTRRLHATRTELAVDKKKTIDKLFKVIQKKTDAIENKVTMVGVGQVGMAAIFAMLTQNVTNNIAMVDVEPKRLKAELMDLQHGSCFLKSGKIQASSDYAISAGSRVCVVTAGVRQRTGESRLALVQRNTDVLKNIIPKLMKHSPDTIFLLASNPVDVLTYVTWKLSGITKNRVIGSGTNLDSARFRYLLSEKLGIATDSCHGYIIGEHGDSAVPVWSGVNIAGVRLTDLNQKIGTDGDPEEWMQVYHTMVKSSYEVHRLKGYTSWAIGLSLSQIVNAILSNANTVHPVSTCLKGEHGIKDEVFLSLPCVINHSGIADVVRQTLTETERKMLQKSAQAMAKIQGGIKL